MLYLLLKKDSHNVPWRDLWTTDHTQAFNQLKKELTAAPVLVHPDFTLPFYSYSDASKSAIGGCLVQIVDRQERLIGYFSRRLTHMEEKRSIAKKNNGS